MKNGAIRVYKRIATIVKIVAEILWRSLGLSLRYLPVGLAGGAVIAIPTGDPSALIIGALSGWLSALFKAYGMIGEEIALTAKVTPKGLNRSFRSAIDEINEQEQELPKKRPSSNVSK